MRGRLAPGATLLLALAFAGSDVPAAADYASFVMTYESYSVDRIHYADGRMVAGTATYRLEYRRRGDWDLFLVEDTVRPEAHDEWHCRAGQRVRFDAAGRPAVIDRDRSLCWGVNRWIGSPTLATARWWVRREGPLPGQVTYTDPGERVVFDLRTGLPASYEAGLVDGGVASYRETYRLISWGAAR